MTHNGDLTRFVNVTTYKAEEETQLRTQKEESSKDTFSDLRMATTEVCLHRMLFDGYNENSRK